jgi:hypothetical protein
MGEKPGEDKNNQAQYRKFQETRLTPSYFKQISSADYSALSTLINIDYQGGRDIYVSDFDSNNVSNPDAPTNVKTTDLTSSTDGIQYMSGSYMITDPQYNPKTAEEDENYKASTK